MTNRLPPIESSTATAEQAAAIDSFLAHRRGIETSPANLYGMLFTSPGAGTVLSELGAFCRFRSIMPKDALEVAILTTLHALDFDYEVGPHRAYARTLGIDDTVLDAIGDGRPAELRAELGLASRIATALLGRAPVAGDLFDEAVATWGAQAVVDLTVTVGYYSLLALTGRMLTPELDRE